MIGVWNDHKPIRPDHRIVLPVYDEYEWKHKYGIDQSAHYRYSEKETLPYTLWKRGPFTSTYVNIDSFSLRVTPKSPLPSAKKVFVFGGSTVWGTGSPDSLTVPALLQTKLGKNYDVHNYGEAAYVHAQEQQLLLAELCSGKTPDIVIFLDGANDTYAGVYSPGIPRHPHQLGSPITSFIRSIPGMTNYAGIVEWSERKLRGDMRETEVFDSRCRPHIESRAVKTVNSYLHMAKQTSAIGDDYGFDSYFFWQPTLLASTRNLLPYEDLLCKKYSPTMAEVFRKTDSIARRLFAESELENVFYIGSAFDSLVKPIYIDWCHVGPQGNDALANNIANKILAQEDSRVISEADR